MVGANPGVASHCQGIRQQRARRERILRLDVSSTLVNALNSCRAAGANVVSMSLGGAFKSRTEELAFNDANKAGVLSIAAAGNAGNNTTSYPAGYASVMSVAAVDANEVKGSFSQVNKDVEIAAPGVAVLSTTPWLDLNTLGAGAATWSGGRLDGARAPRRLAVSWTAVCARQRGHGPAKWCCVSEAASRLPTRSPTFRWEEVLRQSFTTAPRAIRRAACTAARWEPRPRRRLRRSR